MDCGLGYEDNIEFRLLGNADSDYVGSAKDRKITSGCCFGLGLGVISCLSRNKMSVFLSKIDAEYTVACSSCSEEVWLRKLSEGFFDAEMDATEIYCDNQSCIKLTEKLVFHDKSKHIEIKHHYI